MIIFAEPCFEYRVVSDVSRASLQSVPSHLRLLHSASRTSYHLSILYEFKPHTNTWIRVTLEGWLLSKDPASSKSRAPDNKQDDRVASQGGREYIFYLKDRMRGDRNSQQYLAIGLHIYSHHWSVRKMIWTEIRALDADVWVCIEALTRSEKTFVQQIGCRLGQELLMMYKGHCMGLILSLIGLLSKC